MKIYAIGVEPAVAKYIATVIPGAEVALAHFDELPKKMPPKGEPQPQPPQLVTDIMEAAAAADVLVIGPRHRPLGGFLAGIRTEASADGTPGAPEDVVLFAPAGCMSHDRALTVIYKQVTAIEALVEALIEARTALTRPAPRRPRF